MSNEHSDKINKILTEIQMLYNYRTVLENKLNNFENQEKSADLIKQKEVLENQYEYIDDQIKDLKTNLMKARQFDTEKLTKHLAKVLTSERNELWLPIKFLIEPATQFHDKIEGYGVILGQSMFCLPNLADTIVLLSNDEYTTRRYRFKYNEDNGNAFEYESIDDRHNIWSVSSKNFISVGTKPIFDAIFDNNNVSKPFLHIALKEDSKNSLKYLGRGFKSYDKYDISSLEEDHPRKICSRCIEGLMVEKLDTLEKGTINTLELDKK